MAQFEPFQVLGIAATLNVAEVKRAYFAELRKHPPHADPEAFRRLRMAYEELTAPGGLPLAFIAVPVDVASELATWRKRWEAPMREAAERVRRDGERSLAVGRFVHVVSRLALAEVADRFAEVAQRAPDPVAPRS